MKALILLLLSFNVVAQNLDADDIAKMIVERNIIVESYSHQQKEFSHTSNQILGNYDYSLSLSVSKYRDKALQDSVATPSNINTNSYKLKMNKKWQYGIKSSLFVTNDQNEYTGVDFGTFSAQEYSKNKNYLGASLEVDLSQNIGGRIDRAILDNLDDQQELYKMSAQEKIESYLFLGISEFYQAILNGKRSNLYFEMKDSAMKLLRKAEVRRRKGVVDNRELLVYRSNLSSMNQLTIQSQNVLDKSKTNFAKYVDIDLDEKVFVGDVIISEKERLYLRKIQRQDFASLAKKNRTVRIFKNQLKRDKRELKNSSRLLLPQMSLSFSAMGTGSDDNFGDSFKQARSFDKPQYAVGLSVTFPLGNRTARNKHSAMKHLVRRRQLEYQDGIKNTTNDLKLVAAELSRLLKLSDISRKHQQNEKKKYRNELKEYSRGRSGAKDVVQFQNDYFNAKIKTAEAVIGYKVALNRYLLMTGDISNYYSIKYNGVEL